MLGHASIEERQTCVRAADAFRILMMMMNMLMMPMVVVVVLVVAGGGAWWWWCMLPQERQTCRHAAERRPGR